MSAACFLGLAALVLTSHAGATDHQRCGCELTIIPPHHRVVIEPFASPEGTINIPVTIHAVRRADGSGGWDLENLDRLLDQLNRGFEGSPFVFCRPLPIQEIRDDLFFDQIDTRDEIDALRLTYAVPNTINIYFVDELADESGPLCGTSSFSFDAVQGVVIKNICDGVPTITEQVGHYFDLFHTHETMFGVECTSGDNCEIAGDLVCDTPADPDLTGRTNAFTCEYTGDVPPPCPDDPPYAPLLDNYMSAASGRCKASFTPGQVERMTAVLFTHRANLLDRPCDPFPRYEATSLGVLDQDVSSTSTSLNERGDVVGASFSASGFPRAFRWTVDGIVALAALPGFERASVATDVNERGFVSGWSQSDAGDRRATAWSGPNVIDLGGTPNGTSAEARAISDTGVVVGFTGSPAAQLATAWRRPQQPLSDERVGFGSAAHDVNERASIVGVTQFNRGPQAFSFIDGVLDIIELEQGTISEANAINGHDAAVGWSAAPDRPHLKTAMLWSQGDALPLPGLGGPWSIADDISDDGWVVGRAATAEPARVDAFLSREGTTVPLRMLLAQPRRLIRADAINNQHQVAATAEGVLGSMEALLLTPALLNLNRPNPGLAGIANRVVIHGATPGGTVTLLVSHATGTAAYPGCDAVALHLVRPTIVTTGVADGDGLVRLSFDVPPDASGRTFSFQAVDPAQCAISQVRTLEFD